MADSNIQLNTDGTGKKIDTRTEATNGEHRQVFVIGDPSTNAGVAPVDGTKGLAVDLTATGANATALKVDGSAVTQPVSGTVTANAGSGTMAVSAASLPLPSGAATAAKQPAIGTAGTASTDVITVQGIASGTPQPVSATSLPLPTGAATAANQATEITSLSTIATNTGAATPAGTNLIGKVGIDQTTPGTTNAVKATNFPTTVDTNSGVKGASTPRVTIATDDTNLSNISSKLTYGYSDFFPQYNNMTQPLAVSTTPLLTTSGLLLTESNVSTDSGSVRANFTGSSLLSSLGSCTFTNGSPFVTGSGFSSLSVEVLSMVKLNADTEASFTPVQYIISDTQLQLAYPYVGTSTTGAASYAPLATSTGTGATISVASGQCTLASGTTNASQSFLWGLSSTGDLQVQAAFSLSQRIANQDWYFGLEDNALATITKYSRFHFSGTDNTKVITETAYNPSTTPSANEAETNTVTLPNGATTASSNVYKIGITQDSIVFSINGVVVATHTKRIPHIRRTSNIGFVTLDLRVLNGTGASNTNCVLDYVTGRLYNRLDTIQSSPGDITNSQVVSQKNATTASNTLQNAVSATGNGVSLNTDGMSTASFTVSGTFSATVTFEGTEDGTNWNGLNTTLAGSNAISSTTTATGTYIASVSGYQLVRARVTWTSGTSITVTAHATPLNTTARVVNANNLVQAQTSLPTAATSGNPTAFIADKYGRSITIPGTIRDLVGTQPTTITASTSETTFVTAGAAGVFNDLTFLKFSNTSATGIRVDIRDTTAGSILDSWWIPANDTRGGALQRPWPQTNAATNWTIQCSASITDLRVFAIFDKNK